jgi:hypothetical protein
MHEQADLSFVYAIHRALTEDALSLAQTAADLDSEDRAERIPAIRRYVAAYRAQLISHLRHEAEVFYPALDEKIGAGATARYRLTIQRKGLEEAIDALTVALAVAGDERNEFAPAKARAVAAADDLVCRLGEHLGVQETIVLPAFALAVSQAEIDELQARARAMEPFEQLFFMVPWMFDRIPSGAREAALRNAPEVMRVIYLVHVQEYRDLARVLAPRNG